MDIIAKIREVDAKSKGLNNVSTGAGDLMKEVIFSFALIKHKFSLKNKTKTSI